MILWIFCGFLIGYLARIPPVVLSQETITLWQAAVTTLAVAVALFATIRPAWKEARRNERVADNLRLRLEQTLAPFAVHLLEQLKTRRNVILIVPIYRKYFDLV